MADRLPIRMECPRRIKNPASQPPAMLPNVAPMYTMMSGTPRCCISTWKRSLKYFGSQNRQNHQIASVVPLESANLHVPGLNRRALYVAGGAISEADGTGFPNLA